jgi:hypothetical protein
VRAWNGATHQPAHVKGASTFFGGASRQSECFVFFHQRQLSNHARFFILMAANKRRIAPVTHQDQAPAERWPLPWRLLARPRRTLVPRRVQEVSQSSGCRLYGANPLLAHGAGDPLLLPLVTAIRRPIQSMWLSRPRPRSWLVGSPSSFRQSSALHRTACPPSGCDSRHAPACGPTP